MAVLNIRGHSVEVDIEEELSKYDFGYRARWTADKLVASSPFRDDRAPSFYVYLDGELAGVWGDSGALDEEYSTGNFVSLIAHMRATGYEEAEEYLLDEYGALYEIEPDEPIRIKAPKLDEHFSRKEKELPAEMIKQATSPYLLSRGICEEVQRKFSIGYGEEIPGHTAIPWYNTKGQLANVKYRSTRDKRFFYAKDATPVSSLVYGLDIAEREGAREVVICEGEIDALSWETAGMSAIALGGAHASSVQIDLIKRSCIRTLYLGGDNDEQGRKLNDQIWQDLGGHADIFTIEYGEYKDANDVLMAKGVEGLEEVTSGKSAGKRLQFCNINVSRLFSEATKRRTG